MAASTISRWLLDIEHIWPVPAAAATCSPRDAVRVWAKQGEVTAALESITPPERDRVLRFYRPNDAKLCLGSYLLKHLSITQACGIPWSKSLIGEDKNRKPCYVVSGGQKGSVEFNATHHSNIVGLVSCVGSSTKVGIDVVHVSWTKDRSSIRKSGFFKWVQTYEAMFSEPELKEMAHYAPKGLYDLDDIDKAKLRHFYAHWSLKEAYIKMTGEAMMAPWLKDLEFRNVMVPESSSESQNQGHGQKPGQVTSEFGIFLHGVRVTGVKMELQAFGQDYMVATAVSNVKAQLPPFKEINLERDLVPYWNS